MGRLYGIVLDIKGENLLAEYEVIKIVDDINHYLCLHGID